MTKSIAAMLTALALCVAGVAAAQPTAATLGLESAPPQTAQPLYVRDRTGAWVEIGVLNSTTHTFTQLFGPPGTASGSITLTPGAAPTGTPPDGAIWCTDTSPAGCFAQINGAPVALGASVGAASAGGSSGQVQYNCSGLLCGIPGFTWNGSTLTLPGSVSLTATQLTYDEIAESAIGAGKTITLGGYATPGDAGAGTVMTSEGATSGGLNATQDVNDVWFNQVLTNPTLAGSFGGACNGAYAADDTTPINAALAARAGFGGVVQCFGAKHGILTIPAGVTYQGAGQNAECDEPTANNIDGLFYLSGGYAAATDLCLNAAAQGGSTSGAAFKEAAGITSPTLRRITINNPCVGMDLNGNTPIVDDVVVNSPFGSGTGDGCGGYKVGSLGLNGDTAQAQINNVIVSGYTQGQITYTSSLGWTNGVPSSTDGVPSGGMSLNTDFYVAAATTSVSFAPSWTPTHIWGAVLDSFKCASTCAAPSVIGTAKLYLPTDGTALALPLASGCANTSGNYAYLSVGFGIAGVTPGSVTDSRGNTWTKLNAYSYNTKDQLVRYYAPVTASLLAGDVITIPWTGSAKAGAAAFCMTGMATSSVVDVNGTGANGATAKTVSGLSTGTLAQANEVVFGSVGPETRKADFDEWIEDCGGCGGGNNNFIGGGVGTLIYPGANQAVKFIATSPTVLGDSTQICALCIDIAPQPNPTVTSVGQSAYSGTATTAASVTLSGNCGVGDYLLLVVAWDAVATSIGGTTATNQGINGYSASDPESNFYKVDNPAVFNSAYEVGAVLGDITTGLSSGQVVTVTSTYPAHYAVQALCAAGLGDIGPTDINGITAQGSSAETGSRLVGALQQGQELLVTATAVDATQTSYAPGSGWTGQTGVTTGLAADGVALNVDTQVVDSSALAGQTNTPTWAPSASFGIAAWSFVSDTGVVQANAMRGAWASSNVDSTASGANVLIDDTGNGTLQGFDLSGLRTFASSGDGVQQNAGSGFNYSGATACGNGGTVKANFRFGVGVSGNALTDARAGGGAAGLPCAGFGGVTGYGVVLAGQNANMIVQGNDLTGVTTPILGAPTGDSVCRDNAGTADFATTLASAASITLPNCDAGYYVSGTTQLANMAGGWNGRAVNLVFTNASPGGVATGGTSGTAFCNAVTATQNAIVSETFDAAAKCWRH